MTSDNMRNIAKDIEDNVDKTAADAQSATKAAAAKAGNAARDFASQAGDSVSEIYGRAQDQLRAATDRFPDAASDAAAAGQRIYEKSSATVAKQVSKQPLEALLLAAAIGYLVGWATNRS